MASVNLKFDKKTNMFGTTITLSSKDKSYDKELVKNLEFDPLKNNSTKVKEGYLFRSPNIDEDVWRVTFATLGNVSKKFSLKASMDKNNNKVTGLIRFEDKNDAALFAWTNVENWQKWSDAQEEEAQAETKKKPPKVKVDKNGKATVTVTVETLGE